MSDIVLNRGTVQTYARLDETPWGEKKLNVGLKVSGGIEKGAADEDKIAYAFALVPRRLAGDRMRWESVALQRRGDHYEGTAGAIDAVAASLYGIAFGVRATGKRGLGSTEPRTLWAQHPGQNTPVQ